MNMTALETCYKAFRREILQSIPIEEDRFDFEPEITVKIAKRRLRVYKVGISGSRELRGRRHPRQSEDSCALWTLLTISAPVSFGTVSYLQPSHTLHTSIKKVGGA